MVSTATKCSPNISGSKRSSKDLTSVMIANDSSATSV